MKVLSDQPHLSNLASLEQVGIRCTKHRWKYCHVVPKPKRRTSWCFLVSLVLSLFDCYKVMKCKDEMYLPMPKSTTDVSASTDSMISLRSPRRSICEGFQESEGWRKEKRWRERREWDQRASRWDYSLLDFIPNHTPNLSPAPTTSLSLAFSLAPSLTR